MKHRIFYQQRLVLFENKGKYTLYKRAKQIPRKGELKQLQAVDFIPENADYIAVYPECGLIVANEALYSVNGEKIAACPLNGIQISSKHGVHIIMTDTSSCRHKHLILWDGTKSLLNVEYQKFVESDFYFAVYDKKWSVYDWKGHLKNKDYQIADDDIRIEGHFLIKTSAGNHELYSLKQGQLLKRKQNVIMCSKTDDFALCASLNRRVEIFHRDGWYCLNDITFFGLLEDIKLFYVQQEDKYYLYRDSRLEPFLEHEFPEGFDFVSFDEQTQTLIVKSAGKTFIINKRKALGIG